MQKIVGTTAEDLFESLSGGSDRQTRVLVTVVGDGTVYIDSDPAVTSDTGVPLVAGQFYADDFMNARESIYAVAETGTVDVRIMALGAAGQ